MHLSQKALCKARLNEIATTVKNTKQHMSDKSAIMLEQSNLTIQKICASLGLKTDLFHLANGLLEEFAKIHAGLLKCFIVTCNPDYLSRSKLPNKGNVQEANKGVKI